MASSMKAKKRKLLLTRLNKIFTYWKKYSERKHYVRFLLEKIILKKTSKKLTKILTSWNKKYLKITLNKNNFKTFRQNKIKAKTRSLLLQWNKKLIIKLRHRQEKALVPIFSRNRLIKYLIKWNKLFLTKRKIIQLKHTSKKFLMERLISQSWSK